MRGFSSFGGMRVRFLLLRFVMDMRIGQVFRLYIALARNNSKKREFEQVIFFFALKMCVTQAVFFSSGAPGPEPLGWFSSRQMKVSFWVKSHEMPLECPCRTHPQMMCQSSHLPKLLGIFLGIAR